MLTSKQKSRVLSSIAQTRDCNFKDARKIYADMPDNTKLRIWNRIEPIPNKMSSYAIKLKLECLGKLCNDYGIRTFLSTNKDNVPSLKINSKKYPDMAVVYFAKVDLYRVFIGGGHHVTYDSPDRVRDEIDYLVE